MKRRLPAILLLLLLPGAALGSTIRTDRTLVISEPIADNAYLGGTDVNVAAALSGDVLAAGGTLTLSAPIGGDALLVGGTIDIGKPVKGDVRAVAGRIVVEDSVGGDLVLAAGQVLISGTASSTRIAGGSVTMNGGANGEVVIYAADVTLSGEYQGDVEVIASDRLALAPGTIIHGVLKYNAPQEADIPATAETLGGVTYTGSASYLPTTEEAKRFAIAGAGVLLVVRIIAAVIAAGLLAGLFPLFTARVADHVLAPSPRRFILLALLGFGVVVATPVLILLLLLSFVGMVVALLLTLAYLALIILAYLYAGILAGAALSRGIFKRQGISWRGAVLGMLVLYVIGIIPVFGPAVTLVLGAAAMGSILVIAYRFAFKRIDGSDIDL